MEDDDRYTRITLRLPKDLHTRLQEASDASSKSMNAEIVNRLQESFDAKATININADSYEDAIVLMGRILLGADSVRPADKKKFDPEMAHMIEAAVEKAGFLAKAKKKPNP